METILKVRKIVAGSYYVKTSKGRVFVVNKYPLGWGFFARDIPGSKPQDIQYSKKQALEALRAGLQEGLF